MRIASDAELFVGKTNQDGEDDKGCTETDSGNGKQMLNTVVIPREVHMC